MFRLVAVLALVVGTVNAFTTNPAFVGNQQMRAASNLGMADIIQEAPAAAALAIRYVRAFLFSNGLLKA